MAVTTNINLVTDTFYLLFLVVAAYLVIKTRVPQQTIENQKQLIDTYEKRINSLEEQQLESIKALADLQGQLKTYKEVPLENIASALHSISTVNQSIAESNRLILGELKNTAIIAAQDRDVLTNQNLHVRNEVNKQMNWPSKGK